MTIIIALLDSEWFTSQRALARTLATTAIHYIRYLSKHRKPFKLNRFDCVFVSAITNDRRRHRWRRDNDRIHHHHNATSTTATKIIDYLSEDDSVWSSESSFMCRVIDFYRRFEWNGAAEAMSTCRVEFLAKSFSAGRVCVCECVTMELYRPSIRSIIRAVLVRVSHVCVVL